MKRLIYIVFAIHAFLILLVYFSDVTNQGEDWSWMAAFFLDFPLSIGIHEFLQLIERTSSHGNDALELLIIHTIAGGIWWVGIAAIVKKIFWKK